MGQMVIALMVNRNPTVSGSDSFGKEFLWPLELPDGTVGICYVFKSKASARKFYGKDFGVHLIQIADERGNDEIKGAC